MESISERLREHLILGLDACVFIYQLEAHPKYVPLTRVVLEGVENGRWRGVTSTLTIMEVTVRAWRLGQRTVAREYEALLADFPNLVLADVTRDVARRAAQLRAAFNLGPADALQVASTVLHGATAFVTNDRALRRLAPTHEVILLEDLLEAPQHR